MVVFQTLLGPAVVDLAARLRQARVKTVFVTGDLVGHEVAEAVDRVVVASEEMRRVAGSYRDKTAVIESPIETRPEMVKDYRRARNRDLRVVWVGYPENLRLLAPVRAALADPRLADYRLVTISRGSGVTYQWHRRRVWHQLMGCDIAVLPSAESEWYAAKPNTRMTMFKALGIPIVASPIRSYVETLTHGVSCYFAQAPVEWAEAFMALRNPDQRRQIGLAERPRILATYGLEAIGAKWLALFRQLVPDRSWPVAPMPAKPGKIPS